jgi:UDP-N-acetylmuramoylalanine--D-glutamate ligase
MTRAQRLEGKSVAVIGLGVSGVAAARLAFAKGGEVYVSDSGSDASTTARAADLRTTGIAVELGGHDLDRVASAGIVVVSPGIPPTAPVLEALRARGIRWISEPELAVRFYSDHGSRIWIARDDQRADDPLRGSRLADRKNACADQSKP